MVVYGTIQPPVELAALIGQSEPVGERARYRRRVADRYCGRYARGYCACRRSPAKGWQGASSWRLRSRVRRLRQRSLPPSERRIVSSGRDESVVRYAFREGHGVTRGNQHVQQVHRVIARHTPPARIPELLFGECNFGLLQQPHGSPDRPCGRTSRLVPSPFWRSRTDLAYSLY